MNFLIRNKTYVEQYFFLKIQKDEFFVNFLRCSDFFSLLYYCPFFLVLLKTFQSIKKKLNLAKLKNQNGAQIQDEGQTFLYRLKDVFFSKIKYV
jgi:hypothetical protein